MTFCPLFFCSVFISFSILSMTTNFVKVGAMMGESCWKRMPFIFTFGLSFRVSCLGVELALAEWFFMGNFNDTPIWVVRKNKQRSKTFKYVYIRSTKEVLKHIPLAVNSLLPLFVPKSRAQISFVLPSPSTLSLSSSGYRAILRVTRNFLIFSQHREKHAMLSSLHVPYISIWEKINSFINNYYCKKKRETLLHSIC